MPDGNKKVTQTWTNLQLKASGLFKYVTFLLPPGIKGLMVGITYSVLLPTQRIVTHVG